MVTVGVRGFVQATTAVSASKRRRSGIGPMTIPTAFLRGHECLKQTCVCPSIHPSVRLPVCRSLWLAWFEANDNVVNQKCFLTTIIRPFLENYICTLEPTLHYTV